METPRGAAAPGGFPNHAAHIAFLKELNKIQEVPILRLTGLQVAFGGVTKLPRGDAGLASTCYIG